MHLQCALDEHAGRVVVVSAIDNLGKGAAGQALQNANLMLGLDESAGPHRERSRPVTVTSPKGFRAAGVTAGIKASGRPDLALVVNDGPLDVAAGVFTGNRFKAAPVLWSQQAVADGRLRAVVLNSGGANACTGPDGFADTHHTAEHVAAVLTAAGDRDRARRRGGLLDRPHRRAPADAAPARRGRRGHRRAVGGRRRGRCRRRS